MNVRTHVNFPVYVTRSVHHPNNHEDPNYAGFTKLSLPHYLPLRSKCSPQQPVKTPSCYMLPTFSDVLAKLYLYKATRRHAS